MQTLKCDNCGRDIPIVIKRFCGMEVKVFDTGKINLKEWNVRNLFLNYDLCRQCAHEMSAKLDYELLKVKTLGMAK